MFEKPKAFFQKIKTEIETKRKTKTKEEKEPKEPGKIVSFMNRFSLLFHGVLAFLVVFGVELVSRRDFISTVRFLDYHTWAFVYNMFLVFCSLILVYLFRRRTFVRVIITGLWMFLGIVNGCVLSNRVTPFGYTDLKCLPELFAMSNTNYFTAEQAMVVVAGVGSFVAFCVILFLKGPRYKGEIHKIMVPVAVVAMVFVGIPMTTEAAQNTNVLTGYFANIAQGYENYGFIYGFSCSVVDRGMNKPENYSQETIEEIQNKVKKSLKKEEKKSKNEKKTSKKKNKKQKQPNVICVLLESFCDPDEINFLETNKDPVPTFHKLKKKFTSGYLTVPVVGAGTANTEFEILTGMSMKYFGTGEYPYKTILKKTDNCESVASDLATLGYGSHVVHNNGGNFYSRTNAFSKFGFDTFTCKEMLDIQKLTPNGSWAEDGIMVEETTDSMDLTPDAPDFTYIITVGSHGDYPKQQVIPLPDFKVLNMDSQEEEEKRNQWTYYVNQLNEVDTFMKDLIQEVEQRDEDTIIVFFGDHLPTMGLTNQDMKSGDIYKTEYVTWNNMGLKKQDEDLMSYQLLAKTLESVGIKEGTIMTYHQTQADKKDQEKYENGLENLQYDILYGNRYCYNGEEKYPASDLIMGSKDIVISSMLMARDGKKVLINGENFTRWSRVFVNGTMVNSKFYTNGLLAIRTSDVKGGDTVVVNQMGSGDTVFRSSNEMQYEEPLFTPVPLPTASPEVEKTETEEMD